jgi:hypothetical protein
VKVFASRWFFHVYGNAIHPIPPTWNSEEPEEFEKTYEIDPTIEIPSTLTVNPTPAY